MEILEITALNPPRRVQPPASLAGAEKAPPSTAADDSKPWICRISQRLAPPPARIINVERKSAVGPHKEEGEKISAAGNTVVDGHRSPASLPTAATQTKLAPQGMQRISTLSQGWKKYLMLSSAVETGKLPSLNGESTPPSPQPWRRSPETKQRRSTWLILPPTKQGRRSQRRPSRRTHHLQLHPPIHRSTRAKDAAMETKAPSPPPRPDRGDAARTTSTPKHLTT